MKFRAQTPFAIESRGDPGIGERTHSRCLAVTLLVAVAGLSLTAQVGAETPLQSHMQRMLTDGDQWRTPNPDYDPEQGGPSAYGITVDLAPDGSHVSGLLTGLYPDGRQATYWTFLSFYNPVTEKVVTQQIGWDGTLLRGDVPVQPGPVQIVDMIHYQADGHMRISRHDNRFDSRDKHRSIVMDPDGAGGWKQTQSWEWTRQPRPKPAEPSQSPTLSEALAEHVGFLMKGSSRWRSPNPDYEPGGEAPQYYGMNYRLGPHGRHVQAEIMSLFADGREQREWWIYITHNPVTGQSWMEQTGANGVYFRGELGKLENGRHVHAGVVYMPNGTARSVRDEIEMIDESSYRSHVFERTADGAWQKAREWTWELQPGG